MKNKGFTLIELMVVISIVALLSAITMASLIDARKKAVDGNIKTQLQHIRTQAANYYSSNGNSYSGVCSAGALAISLGIPNMLNTAASLIGATIVTAPAGRYGALSSTKAFCYVNGTGTDFAFVVALQKPTLVNPTTGIGGGWCIDARLNAVEITTMPATPAYCK